jgi:hypothetical protein
VQREHIAGLERTVKDLQLAVEAGAAAVAMATQAVDSATAEPSDGEAPRDADAAAAATEAAEAAAAAQKKREDDLLEAQTALAAAVEKLRVLGASFVCLSPLWYR